MKGINKALLEAKKFIIVFGDEAPDNANKTVNYYFKERDFKNAKFYETVYHLIFALRLSKITEYDISKVLLYSEWKRAVKSFRYYIHYKYR